jgi:hypothetical protein
MSGRMKSRLWLLGLFLSSLTITLILVPWRSRNTTETQSSLDIKKISGISVGDIAALPTMQNLNLESVRIDSGEGEHGFFVIFSSSCDACERDVDFWKLLAEEAVRRKVTFYLMAIDRDGEAVRLFLDRFGLRHLPTVIDREGEASRNFKISMVPQYLLVTKKGRVVGRWTGLSHFDPEGKKVGSPGQMFDLIGD